jgi:hypothetical protein
MKATTGEHTSSIDLERWELEAVDNCSEAIKAAVLKSAGEALGYALADDETFASAPVMDSKCTVHPLTLHLNLALNVGGNFPAFEFNLREVIDGFFEDDWLEDGGIRNRLQTFSAALKELAAEIDDACAKANV